MTEDERFIRQPPRCTLVADASQREAWRRQLADLTSIENNKEKWRQEAAAAADKKRERAKAKREQVTMEMILRGAQALLRYWCKDHENDPDYLLWEDASLETQFRAMTQARDVLLAARVVGKSAK